MHSSSELGVGVAGQPIGDRSFTRATLVLPRVELKPMLAVAEAFTQNPSQFRRRHPVWNRTLSVFKLHGSGSLVLGGMDSENFGVPLTEYQFSEKWEYLLTRGMVFDIGE